MRISDWSSDVCSSDLVAVAVQRELRSHAEQRRERDAFDQLPGVSVDLVLQAGIARRFGRRRVVDRERAAVGHDQPLPDDLRTRLAERGFAVVAADQPRALRSEEHTSELQSLMRISYAVFCLKTKQTQHPPQTQPKANTTETSNTH